MTLGLCSVATFTEGSTVVEQVCAHSSMLYRGDPGEVEASLAVPSIRPAFAPEEALQSGACAGDPSTGELHAGRLLPERPGWSSLASPSGFRFRVWGRGAAFEVQEDSEATLFPLFATVLHLPWSRCRFCRSCQWVRASQVFPSSVRLLQEPNLIDTNSSSTLLV